MCGRYAFFSPTEAVAELFDLDDPPAVEFSFNVAPTDYVPAVRTVSGSRQLGMLRWGLIPFWAKAKDVGVKMINARAESVSNKPAYRRAFQQRRCLLPANGFFEWQKQGKQKQPYFIHFEAERVFAFAGIWESWGKEEDKIESVSIITTEPNSLVAPIHNRMPVILGKSQFAKWLGEEPAESEELLNMLQPCKTDAMRTRAVGKAVGNPRNKGEDCILPVPTQESI